MCKTHFPRLFPDHYQIPDFSRFSRLVAALYSYSVSIYYRSTKYFNFLSQQINRFDLLGLSVQIKA